MLGRFIILLLYLGGFGVLRWYLAKNPSRFNKNLMVGALHPVVALVWMWGPLLWFLPGFLWVGLLPVPADFIIALSILVPLGIFLMFAFLTSLFPPTPETLFNVSLTGILLLLVGMLTLLVLRGLFTYAFSGWQFILFLIFITAPPVVALLLVMAGVIDIVPLDFNQQNRWLMALQLFIGFFTTFPKPVWVVEDGKVQNRIEGNPFLGFGHGWVMTEPENVVVLKGGTDIRRIVGPGVVLTEKTESPYGVIDLRNQIRTGRVDAVTRDGIEVNLPIGSLFQINPGNKPIDLKSLEHHDPWPYHNQRDIYRAVFAEVVDPAGKTPLEAHQLQPWDELPLKAATNRLKQVTSEYNLKDLYSVDPDTRSLRRTLIGKAVRDTVIEAVRPYGIKITGGGVGNTVNPTNTKVIEQQVAVWKARWVDKVKAWESDVKAERVQKLAAVHSTARVDLLSGLLGETKEIFQMENYSGDLIAYHLLENLLHMARNPEVQQNLPPTTLPTLTDLCKTMQED